VANYEQTQEYKEERVLLLKKMLKKQDIKFISGEYQNRKSNFLVECNKCKYQWHTNFNAVQQGLTGCKGCSGQDSITLDKIINKFKKEQDYQFIKNKDQIKNNKSKFIIKHKECGTEFETYWLNYFVNKSRCPVCSIKLRNLNKRKESYLDFKKIIKNEGYKLLDSFDNYMDKRTKLKIKHLKCGNILSVNKDNFVYNFLNRCPYCETSKNVSSNEIQILNYIKKIYKGKIKLNDRDNLKKINQELDIYLPDLKLAFEFNGLYWHSEKFKDKDYHYNKMVECHNKGIRLIQIWENEWEFKRNIIKSKIKYLLNKIKPDKRLNARKCYIKEISKEKCNKFLINNHIQGKSSKYLKTYGMFYKETKKLVAVMTFAQGNANRGSQDIELSRYTTKRFYNIRGGFSKMLSFAINENKWKEIYSYADLRLSDGNLYESNGWKRLSYVKPGYYYTNGTNIFHKSLFKKSNIKTKFPEIYDESLTEREMMEKTKYLRIWDCGKVKYKYETIK